MRCDGGKTDNVESVSDCYMMYSLVLYYEEITIFIAKYKITESMHFVVNVFSHM